MTLGSHRVLSLLVEAENSSWGAHAWLSLESLRLLILAQCMILEL